MILTNPSSEELLKYLKTHLSEEVPDALYVQLSRLLGELVESGRLTPGYRLDSERHLVKELGVSRRTVRAALTDLISRKLIISVHGRGNFVLRPPKRRMLTILVPEQFQPNHWGQRPYHYEWISHAADEVGCIVHYVYTPTIQHLASIFEYANSSADGILIFRPPQAWLDYLKMLKPEVAARTPVTVVNRTMERPEFSYVSSTHHQAARSAAQHLVDAGHRKIALIAGDPSVGFIREGIQGFEEALKLAKISVKPEWMLNMQSSSRDVEAMEKEIQGFLVGLGVTGVVVCGAAFSLPFELAVRNLGIDVPTRLSAVFSTEEASLAKTEVSWTAYVDQTQHVTTEALRLLSAVIRGEEQPKQKLICPRLQEGKTVIAV